MKSTSNIKKQNSTLQARKLSLIEEFVKISDVALIDKIEKIMLTENSKNKEVLSPMKIEKFYENIDQALLDSKLRNVISQQELKSRVKSWK